MAKKKAPKKGNAKKEAAKKIRKENLNPKWAGLAFLKPVMRKALKKRGVKIYNPKHTREVATKFFRYVLKKYKYNPASDEFAPKNFESFTEIANAVASIIKAIVDFFKNLKKKKKDKKALSSEEKDMLGEAERMAEVHGAKGSDPDEALPGNAKYLLYAALGLVAYKLIK